MLDELPVELLSHIVSFLPRAQSLARLSQSSRSLHHFTEKHGWKIFAQTRFSSLLLERSQSIALASSDAPGRDEDAAPFDYRDASHALTTLSRNYDRRAFIARYVEPSEPITLLPAGTRTSRWQRPKGQSMGSQTVIDSFEAWTDAGWSGRIQVLTYSAGAELVVRLKKPRDLRAEWFVYKEAGHAEGRDDITSINLVHPRSWSMSVGDSTPIRAVVGRANGELALLEIDTNRPALVRSRDFVTGRRSVQSADITRTRSPLLASCLSHAHVALYCDYLGGGNQCRPASEVFPVEGRPGCRVWSTKFLSDERLAVGLGPSPKPVHVYHVTPSGLSKEAIRQFGTDGSDRAADDRVEESPLRRRKQRTTSVHPLCALPKWHGESPGDVFLSGSAGGLVRLHDMRSPATSVATYFDPTDDSAIYSLQTLGRERLVVGTARHSMIKVYDMRMCGGSMYHCLDANTALSQREQQHEDRPSDRCAWNVFLNPRNTNRFQQSGRNSRRSQRSVESPIYSLSSPSCLSPTLFAGVEDHVVQFDFTSMMDRHPDPVFHQRIRWSGRKVDVKKTWNPQGDALNLGMVDQAGWGAPRLRVQTGIGLVQGAIPGLDERWRDGSDV